jgi:hypothetical protein
MSKFSVEKLVSDFEELFKSFELLREYRGRLSMADDQMAIDLCELYAIWGACEIRECISSASGVETTPRREENEYRFGSSGILPKYGEVHKAAQELLCSVASENKGAISHALEEMGVFAFCPTPEQVFPRMEELTSRVSGRAQQVFLVDVSLFAARTEDYRRAGKYVQQARSFDPSSRELYNICVIEGLIAFNNGKVDEAIQSLESSTKACQADVDSSIQCSLLAPNLELAKKLLQVGERTAVSKHLLGCHNVWQLDRPRIEGWIHSIESGDMPDFLAAGFTGDADQLSHRLNVQWMRACSLEMQLNSASPKALMSPAMVLTERESMEAEFEPYLSAGISGTIEYLERDLMASRDKPSSNPAEPGEPE